MIEPEELDALLADPNTDASAREAIQRLISATIAIEQAKPVGSPQGKADAQAEPIGEGHEG
jgi:hypothetical protein